MKDNFFDCGGHFFAAVRLLLAQVRQALGRSPTLAAFADGPTIEQLAGWLKEQTLPRPRSCVVTLQPDEERTPFVCVHAIGGSALA